MKQSNNVIRLVALELIILLAAAPFLGIFSGVKLALAFSIIYFVPVVFFVSLIKELTFLEKFVLSNIVGIAGIAIIYYLMGLAGLPLNKVTFFAVPLVMAIAGFTYFNKSVGKQAKQETTQIEAKQ